MSNLPGGQASLVQFSVMISSPVQLAPPLEGLGLVQDLVLRFLPGPQIESQLDMNQFVQPPSAKKLFIANNRQKRFKTIFSKVQLITPLSCILF